MLDHVREQVDAEHRIHEDDEAEDAAHVDEGREGEHECHDQVAHLLGARALEQAQNAKDAKHPEHPQHHRRDGQELLEQLGRDLVEQRGAHEGEVEAAPIVSKVGERPETNDLEGELGVVDVREIHHAGAVECEVFLVLLDAPVVVRHHAHVGDDDADDEAVKGS